MDVDTMLCKYVFISDIKVNYEDNVSKLGCLDVQFVGGGV